MLAVPLGEDEREEGQRLDDVHRGQVAAGPHRDHRKDRHRQRRSGEGAGGDRPAPGEQEQQRAREAAEDQHPVVVEPRPERVVGPRALVEDEARPGSGHLVGDAVPERDMAAARHQLTLEQGEEGIREADQHAGGDRAGEGELTGVAVAVPPHGDEDRREDEEHRLLGEHGRRGGDTRREVVPEVAARRGGQGEREQGPHHRQVVQEDLPLEDDRERGEPEQGHAEPGRPSGQ